MKREPLGHPRLWLLALLTSETKLWTAYDIVNPFLSFIHACDDAKEKKKNQTYKGYVDLLSFLELFYISMICSI